MAADPVSCPECRAYWQANRDALVGACASVGIEHGLSQGQALTVYLSGFHQAGHKEDYARAR